MELIKINYNELLYFKIYKNFNNVINLKSSFENNPSEKTVHKTRISIRRLLSITKLYLEMIPKEISKNEIKLLNKEIKTYFDTLSPLRDRCVNLLTFDILNLKNNSLREQIKIDITKLIKSTKKTSASFKFNKISDKFIYHILFNQKNINKDLIELLDSKIEHFSENLLFELKKTSNKTSNSDFHKIRINFKKLRYTLEIYKYLEIKTKIKTNNLKSIQDSLGYFQDLSVLKYYLLKQIYNKKIILTIDEEINKVLKDVLRQKNIWINLISDTKNKNFVKNK